MRTFRKNGGQTVLIVTAMFLFIGTILVLGASVPASRESSESRELASSKRTLAVSDAGIEDVSYRVRKGKTYGSVEVITLDGATATTTTVDNVVTGMKEIRATSTLNGYVRKQLLRLVKGDAVSFNYGVQSGNGGFYMNNSASVVGNIYSNGIVDGAGSSLVQGDIVSASSSGTVRDVHATGTVRAHSIINATIDKDAYYTTISGSTVSGTVHPGSADQPSQPFPISDETLDEWEVDALAGGVISSPCPYVITGAQTLGPVKIDCDLTIKTHDTVTLTGMVWVKGNVSFETGPDIALSSSLGGKSAAIIADNPTSRTTNSTITIKNTTTFHDSGTPGSFVMLVSRNRSGEDGGAVNAIELQQAGSGAVMLYTNHGNISISQSSQLSQVAGYKIIMGNSAQIVYDTGVASSLFDTGPGGSWNVYSTQETQ